ncbi:hypothetical protein PVIIG_05705 [Plasmodium vivax India VII]|uniref:Uncharacterized protein n=1 Tax=Plasmodium vivax India VII TaxID=1077284 RepID=A0A0J9S359_PLAVI|nr:hypothetical protein PVIIG_05705 [Plasmodium vivax India VII]
MTSQEPFNYYPDFECYYNLNDRFVLNNRLTVSEAVTNFSSTYPIPRTNNNALLDKILLNLKKYLSDSHSFTKYNQFYICSYINYLLYDQICKEDYSACDQVIFNILKNFVDGYRKHSKSDICESKINYLSQSTYKKHKILYDLYNKYSIIIGKKRSVQDFPCSALHMLIANYNESISKEVSDVIFINKLIELKKLIKDKVFQSNTKCGRDITHFNETNIEKREKELEEAKKRHQDEEEEKKRLQEALDAAQKQQQAEAEVAQERERRVVRTEDEITIIPAQRQALKSLVRGPYEESGAHTQPALAKGLTWEDAKSNEIEEQLHGPKNVWETSPGDDKGIMGKIQSTLSGILGHSLEEEEELTIESHVLSMDNFQEDLQVMTSFIMELWEQTQLIYPIGLEWNNILFLQSIWIE